MKPLFKFVFLLLFTLNSIGAFAQKYNAIFDEDAFNNSPKLILPETGEKSGSKNLKLDLSPHAPIVQHQGKLSSCLAYSLVYNALGIEMGIRIGTTNKEEISALTYSPLYLFKKMNGNRCEDAMRTTETIAYIETHGLLPFNDLPGNKCYANISPEMETKASGNKIIRKVQPLPFNSKDLWDKKNKAIIEILDRMNKPVVVGMYLVDTASFNRLKFPSEIYTPNVRSVKDYDKPSEAGQHAMTVVGYDRRREAFKVLNSWGKNWGNEGYCWIPFDVMGRSTRVAYYLELNEINSSNGSSGAIRFEGQFGFQYLNKGDFTKDIPYHKARGIYELNNKNWKVNQLFQLTTKNGNSGQAICVFSVDNENKIELHWPFSYGLGTQDQMPGKNLEMILPSEDTALEIEKPGADNLIVLYSSNPIVNQWDSIKKKLEKSGNNPDIISRLKDALGNRLIPASEIKYQDSGMNFSTNSTKGDTVPIVLKIQSTN